MPMHQCMAAHAQHSRDVAPDQLLLLPTPWLPFSRSTALFPCLRPTLKQLLRNIALMAAQQPFTIIAHRGDSSAAPENTVQAFDAALQQGFCNFETDCQLSSDVAVVIVHDEQLGRVNDGKGAVAEHTLAQLQQLDAGSWFGEAFAGTRMATLQQLLQRYKGRAHIHLELKSQQPQLPAATAALIQQYGWHNIQAASQAAAAVAAGNQQPGSTCDDAGATGGAPTAAAAADAAAAAFIVPGLTITSFHLQQLQASKQLLPAVPHGWLIQEVSIELVDQAAVCGFEMLCPRANALTAEGVQLIKSRSLVVRAWGVKTIELLHHVVNCGADGATVNWPEEAATALHCMLLDNLAPSRADC